jgi:phage tail-like protein
LAGPPSVLDFHLGEVEDERLWLAARFSSDGRANPSLEQIRIEFDREGYIQNLPAIFREDPGSDLLSRFLTLFETFFEQGQEGIRRLPELFDPYAVPAEALDWLASWLAVELDEDWSDAKRREAVATAYERYARRGTPRGLREELWRQGIRAHIAEPLQSAQVWTLPRDPDPCACGGDSGCDCDCGCVSAGASLGWITMLAPAEWQGAVAGVSATLDQSHLIPGEEIGSPLWRDFAHRFTVYLYRGASDCPGRRAEIETVIAREKPAHTLHRVCAIEPRMRVGFQAVVGFDAVVAGQSPSRLDSGDSNWILGGPPPGRVGASRVGMAARL